MSLGSRAGEPSRLRIGVKFSGGNGGDRKCYLTKAPALRVHGKTRNR